MGAQSVSNDTAAKARAMLAESGLLSAAQPQTIELLWSKATLRRYASGTAISTRGDDMTALILVVEGSLELSISTQEGKRFVRWFLEPGQIQGIIPAIDGRPGIFDTNCHADAVLLLIPHVAFLAALKADSSLAYATLLMLCERSRRQYDLAAADALHSSRPKAARMLLELAAAYGRKDSDGMRIALKISQENFAAMLGIARQQANRILKGLESEGIVALGYSEIVIRDRRQLDAIAEGRLESA